MMHPRIPLIGLIRTSLTEAQDAKKRLSVFLQMLQKSMACDGQP